MMSKPTAWQMRILHGNEADGHDDGVWLQKQLGQEIALQFGPPAREPWLWTALKEGKRVGGLKGFVHWGWLYISHLWVADEQRGFGLGASLLKAVDEKAKAQGWNGLYVDTFSSAAVDFYQRNGYEVFGVLTDFPAGHTRTFLKKAMKV